VHPRRHDRHHTSTHRLTVPVLLRRASRNPLPGRDVRLRGDPRRPRRPGRRERAVEPRWLEGGVIMSRSGEGKFAVKPGTASLYVVTEALFERATAAGAEVTRGLKDEDYCSRGLELHRPRPGGQPLELRRLSRGLTPARGDPVSVVRRVARIVVPCVPWPRSRSSRTMRANGH
jgi:hypothetical protein